MAIFINDVKLIRHVHVVSYWLTKPSIDKHFTHGMKLVRNDTLCPAHLDLKAVNVTTYYGYL